jgi:S1-C subfamily serine protease
MAPSGADRTRPATHGAAAAARSIGSQPDPVDSGGGEPTLATPAVVGPELGSAREKAAGEEAAAALTAGAAGKTVATPAHAGAQLRWRDRVLPRTALGLASMILAASLGAAFSGVVLYSYYAFRLQKTDDRISALINNYKKTFENAQGDLAAQRDAAKADIQKELAPLQSLRADTAVIGDLVKKVAPSMFFVHTLDANGQPVVGSGFVIASDPDQSLIVTSYTTVQAATRRPGPDLFVRQGDQDTKVTVSTWDSGNDLALIVLPKGNLPKLDPAPDSPPLQMGTRIFAVSGLGSQGASVVQGFVTDVSASGIQHNASVGEQFQGGPLVNSDGQIIAVASRSYGPLGFSSDAVWFAPPIQLACKQILRCPNGTLSGTAPQPKS